MGEVNFSDIEVLSEDGKTKLVLEWIGEGLDGDYDPSDPDDFPHLRFTLYTKAEDGQWDQVDDASYCTRLSAWSPREVLEKAAKMLLTELEGNHRVKKRGEELSWIEESWTEPEEEK